VSFPYDVDIISKSQEKDGASLLFEPEEESARELLGEIDKTTRKPGSAAMVPG